VNVLSAHNIKSIEDLRETNYLYIRDTVGQVDFQENLTLLIYGSSISIFVWRTDVVDIHIPCISPGGEIINRYQSSISTVDALVLFLTSISAIDTTEDGQFQERGVYQSRETVVFIVGTHNGQLKSWAVPATATINKSLVKIIREHNFSGMIRFADSDSTRLTYNVNNTSENSPNFEIFRSHIYSYIRSRVEFTVAYPVSLSSFLLGVTKYKSISFINGQFHTAGFKIQY